MKPTWRSASEFDAKPYTSVVVTDGIDEWVAFWWPSMRRMEPDRPFTLWRRAEQTREHAEFIGKGRRDD